jgi:hypothetical protein
VRRALIAVLVAACGKSSPPAAGGSGSAPPGGPPKVPDVVPVPNAGKDDHCELHVHGDVTIDAVVDHAHGEAASRRSRAGAATDYWMTEDELRVGLAAMAGMAAGGNQSYQANATAADEGMKKDPRMFLLTLECGNEVARLQLTPVGGSHYADVPYGPKKYVIASGDGQPGQFVAGLGAAVDGGRQVFTPSAAGELDVTRFDGKGIAGTFRFPAISNIGRAVTVEGSFAYACMGTQACQ